MNAFDPSSDSLGTTMLAGCNWYRLTKREAQVIAQAFTGKTDKEIARAFGNSARTVHHQLQSIYRKLGVRNRTEAIRRLLDWEQKA